MADLSVTSSAVRLQPLSEQEIARTGFTHMARIRASDINGTAGAQGDTITCTIGNTGANFLVGRAAAWVETAFTTTGTLTMEIGTDGDTDNFVTATSVKTAGPIISEPSARVETQAGSSGAATDVLVARFNTQASTGAPGDITAGVVHVFLEIISLAELAKGRAA